MVSCVLKNKNKNVAGKKKCCTQMGNISTKIKIILQCVEIKLKIYFQFSKLLRRPTTTALNISRISSLALACLN